MFQHPASFADGAPCGALTDRFCRAVTYLRVSVTDRCDFRCAYCMSERMRFLPRRELLSLEELDLLCSTFVALGVRKLRLTGGEPLVRRDILGLFRSLSRHLDSGALAELTLTTNGSQLAHHAAELAACGVRRVNVSLDTLDAGKFAALTRRGSLQPVLDGIAAASKAGLQVKINTVALRGINDDEVLRLVAWCGSEGHDLTFIEVMPLGEGGEGGADDRQDWFWPLAEVRQLLQARHRLTDVAETTGGPARYVRLETGQRLGFITPLSHRFCESCNRVRLTCAGELFTCLGHEDRTDLRAVLRQAGREALEPAIRLAIHARPSGHDFDHGRRSAAGAARRHMNHTGG